MPILTLEQLLGKLKDKLGDDTSDDALSLIEDVNDTYAEMENKAKDTTDWKAKYEENDKSWREKYKNRFFSTPSPEEKDSLKTDDDEDDSSKQLTFENLFKEETK